MSQLLIYGGGLLPRALNPLQKGNDWNEVSAAILSRLFQVDERGEVAPDLVEQYDLSDDGLTYTFHLRDARWHDGRRFTAHDTQFTIEKIFESSLEMAANLSMLADSHARSNHVWIARLKKVAPSFVSALTDAPILPKHILEGADFNGDTLDRQPIGTGAYKLIARDDPLGRLYELVAHEDYHFGKPLTPQLKIIAVPDDDERAQRMAAGEFDLCQVKAQHINALRQAGLSIYRFRSGAWRGMPQNLRRPMLQDKRVRQAISEVIVEGALLGLGQPAYLPIAPSSWIYDESLVAKGRDPGRARKLLAEAGFTPNADGMLSKDGELFVYVSGVEEGKVLTRKIDLDAPAGLQQLMLFDSKEQDDEDGIG